VVDARRKGSNQRGPGRTPGARRPRERSLGDRLSDWRHDTAVRRPVTRASETVARLGSRFTGRAAILVVVVAVLVVSYASSLKAYLTQRHEIDSLQTQIAQREKNIDELQSQIDRWEDPAYVEQQARIRFGYTKPGSLSFVALDEHGNRLDSDTSLDDPATVGRPSEPTAWWENAWSSVEVAGNPPRQSQPAASIGDQDKAPTKAPKKE